MHVPKWHERVMLVNGIENFWVWCLPSWTMQSTCRCSLTNSCCICNDCIATNLHGWSLNNSTKPNTVSNPQSSINQPPWQVTGTNFPWSNIETLVPFMILLFITNCSPLQWLKKSYRLWYENHKRKLANHCTWWLWAPRQWLYLGNTF